MLQQDKPQTSTQVHYFASTKIFGMQIYRVS